MISISKRSFLKASSGVIALAAGIGQPARAAEFNLKCGHVLPSTHPTHVRALEMAAAIREQSKGRVDLQIFPSGQLGSDMDQLSQVRSGALDFFSLSPLVLGGLVPSAQLSGLAFAFEDYAHVWKAMDGEVGSWIRSEIEKTSLFAFENIWDNGFRQMTSGKEPIKTPEDLAGFKMRVAVSPIFTSTFKSLGASPVSVNFTEVYSALQTKIVDGMENSLALLHSAKIYEVQKYCALTNHMWDGFWMLGNKKKFERMPKELQKIVRDNVNAAALAQRADVAQLNQQFAAQLKQLGMQINATQSAPFRAKLQQAGFYAEWKSKFGNEAWTVLEKYTGKLS